MNPFVFGKIVEDSNFTDRETELKKITQNMESLTNTILISPRRWGKSSLMLKAAKEMKRKKDYHVCYIDMFRIADENEFYKVLSKSLIKLTSSKATEWTKNALELLYRIKPKVTIGRDPITDFDISLELTGKSEEYAEILNLSEKIAEKKKIKIIICIDEFQNIVSFHKPHNFQKRLRSVWQRHKNTGYFLFGSKQHMMMDIFTNQSMPFYKFGEVIYLDKIDTNEFLNFIINKFAITGKQISPLLALNIVNIAENHPFYVQQLASITWNNTPQKADEKILTKSVNDLITQNSLFFEREYEKLSQYQIRFLKALTDDIESGFSTKKFIDKYDMSSSANTIKARNSLIKNEIIHKYKNKFEFLDPAFKLWLKMLFSQNI